MKTIHILTRFTCISLLFNIYGNISGNTNAVAGTGDVSFTPTGLKFPIMKITLGKNTGSSGTAVSASNEQVLYRCSSTTEANCLKDLASQTDLDLISAAATGATVVAGTYDLVSLYSCSDSRTGSNNTTTISVKGTFTVAPSTVFYTDSTTSNTGGVSSSISSASFTDITNWACATKSILLSTPITVTSSTPVTLTLLVDNTLVANSQASTSSGMGGCKAPSGGGRGICVSIPTLLPYVGTGTTTTKRFKISHHTSSVGSIVDNKANAIIIVPMAGTTPLYAIAIPLYTDTSASISSNSSSPTDTTYGGPSYMTATDISTFKVNADGSIAFSQGASGDTYAASFSAFKLSDHTGTVSTRSGTTWQYHAIPF